MLLGDVRRYPGAYLGLCLGFFVGSGPLIIYSWDVSCFPALDKGSVRIQTIHVES